MAEAWDRQPGEGAKAYAAFCLYRDRAIRDRSLRKIVAAEYAGKSSRLRLFQHWSSKWSWVARSQAHDEEIERARLDTERAMRARLERRRLQSADEDERIASGSLQKVVEWLQSTNGQDLSQIAAIRLFEVAVKVRRTALGEPSEVVRQEQTGPGGGPVQMEQWLPDTSVLSDEERKQFVLLIRKLRDGRIQASA